MYVRIFKYFQHFLLIHTYIHTYIQVSLRTRLRQRAPWSMHFSLFSSPKAPAVALASTNGCFPFSHRIHTHTHTYIHTYIHTQPTRQPTVASRITNQCKPAPKTAKEERHTHTHHHHHYSFVDSPTHISLPFPKAARPQRSCLSSTHIHVCIHTRPGLLCATTLQFPHARSCIHTLIHPAIHPSLPYE